MSAGRLLAAGLLVSVLAAGCASAAPPTAAPTALPALGPTGPPATAAVPRSDSPGCRAESPASLVRGAQIDTPVQSSGIERTYKVYVPTRYDARPTPVIVDLHGYLSGTAGQVAMSNLGALAASAGFILATPQGNGPMPYWNAVPHPDLPDDVQFVADVIDAVGHDFCIDTTRVYVDGFSNGAFLASLVACRLADRVAAVAAVAGLMFPADCAPARPIPILAIHGTADQFVTFDASPNVALASLTWNADSTRAFADLPFAPATAALDRWARSEGCTTPPNERHVTASVQLIQYDGCASGSVLELYVVAGAGHTWPGSAFAQASAPLLGPATHEIDANEVIWEFFQAHQLPR